MNLKKPRGVAEHKEKGKPYLKKGKIEDKSKIDDALSSPEVETAKNKEEFEFTLEKNRSISISMWKNQPWLHFHDHKKVLIN